MAGESDNQVNGMAGPSITEVMEGTGSDRIVAGAVATPGAGSRRPVATTPVEARPREGFDTGDALSDIRDILTWTNHGCSPDARGVWSLSYAQRKTGRL